MEHDIQKQLAAASVFSPPRTPAEKPRPRGIYAVDPHGNRVMLSPGTVKLEADVDKGVHLVGLKDGWRLATAGEVAKEEAAKQPGAKRPAPIAVDAKRPAPPARPAPRPPASSPATKTDAKS